MIRSRSKVTLGSSGVKGTHLGDVVGGFAHGVLKERSIFRTLRGCEPLAITGKALLRFVKRGLDTFAAELGKQAARGLARDQVGFGRNSLVTVIALRMIPMEVRIDDVADRLVGDLSADLRDQSDGGGGL